MSQERSRRRVSFAQLEELQEFIGAHKCLLTGYNKTSQARENSRVLWCHISNTLNSHGDGALKDWRGWCKYWNDLKSKLKQKVANERASRSRTGGGPADGTSSLSDIEKKFVALLGTNFGIGIPGARVEPFVTQPHTSPRPLTPPQAFRQTPPEELGPPSPVAQVSPPPLTRPSPPAQAAPPALALPLEPAQAPPLVPRQPGPVRNRRRADNITLESARRRLVETAERREANEMAHLELLRELVVEIRAIKNVLIDRLPPP